MKFFLTLVIFFFLQIPYLAGQDSLVNKGNVKVDSSAIKSTFKIYDTPGDYRYEYKNKIISQRELNNLLLSTKDEQIIGLVKSSRLSNRKQFIGFGVLPLLGISALLFKSANKGEQTYTVRSNGSVRTSSSENPDRKGLLIGAGISALLGISCPVLSIVFMEKKYKKSSEAIKLYNERY